MKALHYFWENNGLRINTRCGKAFFEKTPSNMTGYEHKSDMMKRLKIK